MFYVRLKNVFFGLIIPLSLLPKKLVAAARSIKLWSYPSISYNNALSVLLRFYTFNYCALNFSCKLFFSSNILSWLSSMMTFNILIIIQSFGCITFRSGALRIEYCFENTVLSVFLFKRYTSTFMKNIFLENIAQCSRNYFLQLFV